MIENQSVEIWLFRIARTPKRLVILRATLQCKGGSD